MDDRFTERLTRAPGLPGGKASVVRELTGSDEFARRRAIATGNAGSDAEIFTRVDMAIAFEPDAELRALSTRHGRHVVGRDTVLPTCARSLDGRR